MLVNLLALGNRFLLSSLNLLDRFMVLDLTWLASRLRILLISSREGLAKLISAFNLRISVSISSSLTLGIGLTLEGLLLLFSSCYSPCSSL